jgi:hypothetical protein
MWVCASLLFPEHILFEMVLFYVTLRHKEQFFLHYWKLFSALFLGMTDVGMYEFRSRYFASKHTNSVTHLFLFFLQIRPCHIFVSLYGVLKPGEFSSGSVPPAESESHSSS